jgi:hypothetical protein
MGSVMFKRELVLPGQSHDEEGASDILAES